MFGESCSPCMFDEEIAGRPSSALRFINVKIDTFLFDLESAHTPSADSVGSAHQFTFPQSVRLQLDLNHFDGNAEH